MVLFLSLHCEMLELRIQDKAVEYSEESLLNTMQIVFKVFFHHILPERVSLSELLLDKQDVYNYKFPVRLYIVNSNVLISNYCKLIS